MPESNVKYVTISAFMLAHIPNSTSGTLLVIIIVKASPVATLMRRERNNISPERTSRGGFSNSLDSPMNYLLSETSISYPVTEKCLFLGI